MKIKNRSLIIFILILSSCVSIKNKKIREIKTNYKSGELENTTEYSKSNKKIKEIIYVPNGKVFSTTIYNKGVLKNKKYFFNNGKIKLEQVFNSNGKPYIFTWYYLNGNVLKVYNHKKHICKIFYENGKLKLVGHYKHYVNSLKEGEWILYYENGNVKIKGFFEADAMIKDWKYYFENGNIHRIKIYTNTNKNIELSTEIPIFFDNDNTTINIKKSRIKAMKQKSKSYCQIITQLNIDHSTKTGNWLTYNNKGEIVIEKKY